MKIKYGLKYVKDFEEEKNPKMFIYAVKDVDEKYDELTKIVNRFGQKYKKQIKWAVLRLKRMVNKRGFQLDQFVNESEKGDLPIYKLKETGTLRLYFIVVNATVVIFGGGGEKYVKSWQDDERLSRIIDGLLDIMIRKIDREKINITKENCKNIFFEIDK